MKKQNGITLIALVITIIVLLILAGVSISMISGDDGIISRASSASEKTNQATTEEIEKLEDTKDYIDQKVNGTVVDTTPIEDSTLCSNDAQIPHTTSGGTISTYNYALTYSYYPLQVSNGGNGVIEMKFYRKDADADDSEFQQVDVYWANKVVNNGTSISHPGDKFVNKTLSSSYEFLAFDISDDNEKSYTLKVEYTYEDGTVKYYTCVTPEGLCFVEGTEVLTETGLVNIEDIKPGIKVYSFNEVENITELKEVLSVSENYTQEEIYKVYVDGDVIESTDIHPYYVKGRGYITAEDLVAGDVLVDVDGNEVVIEKVEVSVSETEIPVYNMNVEDNHNYYVSEALILVHNAACKN